MQAMTIHRDGTGVLIVYQVNRMYQCQVTVSVPVASGKRVSSTSVAGGKIWQPIARVRVTSDKSL